MKNFATLTKTKGNKNRDCKLRKLASNFLINETPNAGKARHD